MTTSRFETVAIQTRPSLALSVATKCQRTSSPPATNCGSNLSRTDLFRRPALLPLLWKVKSNNFFLDLYTLSLAESSCLGFEKRKTAVVTKKRFYQTCVTHPHPYDWRHSWCTYDVTWRHSWYTYDVTSGVWPYGVVHRSGFYSLRLICILLFWRERGIYIKLLCLLL